MIPLPVYRISLFLIKIFYQKKTSQFHFINISRYDINRDTFNKFPFIVTQAQVKLS